MLLSNTFENIGRIVTGLEFSFSGKVKHELRVSSYEFKSMSYKF